MSFLSSASEAIVCGQSIPVFNTLLIGTFSAEISKPPKIANWDFILYCSAYIIFLKSKILVWCYLKKNKKTSKFDHFQSQWIKILAICTKIVIFRGSLAFEGHVILIWTPLKTTFPPYRAKIPNNSLNKSISESNKKMAVAKIFLKSWDRKTPDCWLSVLISQLGGSDRANAEVISFY